MRIIPTFLMLLLTVGFVHFSSPIHAQSSSGDAQSQQNKIADLVKLHPYGDITYIQRNDLTIEQKLAIYNHHFSEYNALPAEEKNEWLSKNLEMSEQMEKESVLLRHYYGYKVPAILLAKYKL